MKIMKMMISVLIGLFISCTIWFYVYTADRLSAIENGMKTQRDSIMYLKHNNSILLNNEAYSLYILSEMYKYNNKQDSIAVNRFVHYLQTFKNTQHK